MILEQKIPGSKDKRITSGSPYVANSDGRL